MGSDKDAETSTFGCKDGCIYYKTGEDPSVERFCFKDGGSIVTCLPEFHWCYEGACGPEFWGDEFPECNGKSQSPIDIVTGPTPVAEPSPLTFGNYDKIRIDMLSNSEEHYHYPGAPEEEKTIRLENGTIKNNGHTAQLDVIATIPGDVGILSGGNLTGEYQILQLHFHWGADDTKGSEHTLDGKMFPLELHIVLKNVMNPDEKFDMSGSTFMITDLIAGIAPGTTYSTYSGSLTTPGCMEVVNWINFLKPIKISTGQLAKFRTLKDNDNDDIVDNFRPVQPLNDRVVTFYGP